MGELRFNLHEGMASIMLARCCHIAPTLRPVLEELRAGGMTDRAIVQYISSLIEIIDAERAAEKETKQ